MRAPYAEHAHAISSQASINTSATRIANTFNAFVLTIRLPGANGLLAWLSQSLAPSEVVPRFLVEEKEQLMRDDYHRLLRAFRALDHEGHGYLEMDRMREIMASQGEPLNEEELSSMMAAACDSNGRIHYEDYAHLLTTDGRNI